MKKKGKMSVLMRVVSIMLVLALVVTSVQTVVRPGRDAKAASGKMDDETVMLSEEHIHDSNVLAFYKILANAQKNVEDKKSGAQQVMDEISDMSAGEIIGKYGSDAAYTQAVPGVYLLNYPGKINFSGLKVGNIEGIGWARSAQLFDLSALTITEIPASEFFECKMTKIILPEGVNKIGDNAFANCSKLQTYQVGSSHEEEINLAQVKEIGAFAFSGCAALTKVNLTTDTNLKIGSSAFASCVGLEQIEIPVTNADNLGANAFENCSSLSLIGLKDDLQYLSDALFRGIGTKLASGAAFYVIGQEQTEVSKLPSNITYIGAYCFSASYLEDMDLQNCSKLTEIRMYGFSAAAFRGKQRLLKLPESLEKIETMAFSKSVIASLRIPDRCITIEQAAFEKSSIRGIRLPAGLTEIEDSVFLECTNLEGSGIEIAAGSKLKKIGKEAFSKCEKLGDTSFLSGLQNLTTIEERAFSDCYNYLKTNNYIIRDSFGENLVYTGLREVVLPDSVTELGISVFENNYALRKADLGRGIIHIPEKAFYNMSTSAGAGLEQVIVSGALESIGKSAFANQTRLHSIGYKEGSSTVLDEGMIQFNEGLLKIEDSAFSGCSVQNSMGIAGVKAFAARESVRTVKQAGDSEFLIYDYENADRDSHYCRKVYVNEEDLLKEDALSQSDYFEGKLTEEGQKKYIQLNILAKKVYVSDDCVKEISTDNTDKSLEYYNQYESETDTYQGILYAGEENLTYSNETITVSKTKKLYCSDADKETAVSLEDGSGKTAYWIAATVGSSIVNAGIKNGTSANISVYYVFGIKNVTLPDSMIGDSLGESVFQNCFSLDTVRLSANLTEIKNNTFSGAGKEVPNFMNLGDKYYDYYGLRTIKIPKQTLKRVGNRAFYQCSNLRFDEESTSALGTALESIGDSSFEECYSLSVLNFPKSLKAIGARAFAKTALLVQDEASKRILRFQNGSQYTYFLNQKTYGTKDTDGNNVPNEKKTGLKKIDFSSTVNLESIGNNAFEQSNLESVIFVKSPLKKIPNGLFKQCTYLSSVTFHKETEELSADVLRDTMSLLTVSIPASARLDKNTVSGAFGNSESSNPSLQLSYQENEKVDVPVNSSKELPIYAFNKDVLNANIDVVVVEGQTEQSIIGAAKKGIRAEVDTSKNPFTISLYGEEYTTEPVTVRVKAATKFQFANSNTYWIAPQTFTYQVSVKNIATENISVSATEDTNVVNNPSMYKDDGTTKTLYLPVAGYAANTGVRLTALIDPVETTDQVSWSSDNPAVVISDETYEKGTGKATAIVKPAEIGDAKITVTAGNKSDVIYVYSKIPVSGSGMTCTTGGKILDTTLKPNAENTPYGFKIGTEDKISVSLDYGTNDYTDEQKQTYGEKPVFLTSDSEIMTVDDQGNIKAVGEGTVCITVVAQASGTKLKFWFNVGNDVNYTPSSVTVTGADEVNVGESIPLTAKVAPEAALQTVTWSVTSGKDRVTVDADGNVTGIAKGDATIVATSTIKDTVQSKPFKITVKAPAKELRILDGNVTLEVGRTMSFTKTTKADAAKGFFVSPVDTTDKIDWKSSNEAVLQVTQGTSQSVSVKALAVGTAELTGTASSGVRTSVVINVIQKTNSITVDKEVTLNTGKTHKLNPQKVPATSNEELTYTYSSSDPKIATVDASGLIRAVAPGTTNINVKSNTGKTASCRVTVKQPANKITLLLNRPSTKTVYLAKGQSVTLNTRLAPENTTDKLTYKSSKSKVAPVTSSGVVTAKKNGSAKITIQADSGKKISVKIVVSKKQVKAKKVKVKAPKTVKRKKTVKLTVSLKSAKSTDTLSFASNKPNIAEIDAYGYLKAKKKGKVKITVTASSGKKAVKTIKVK